MEQQIESLNSEMEQQIESLNSEMEQQIESLNSEMEQQIESLNSEVVQQIESLNSEVVQQSPNTEVDQQSSELEVVPPNTEELQGSPNDEMPSSLDDTSIEIHPTTLNFSHQPISAHCISPHETISPIQMQSLSKYVTVTGNQYRNLFFLALRFKNPVIIQKHFGFSTNTLHVPKETCILVDANSPTLKMKIVEPTVLFTFQNRQGKNPTECELLQMLFPWNSLLVKKCYIRTLFVVSYTNPFKSIWIRVRKNSAFRALVKMYYSCIQKSEPFTTEVASTLRFFKRNNAMNIENFNNWYALAHHMTVQNMFHVFNRDPSICFGRTLFQIMKRSSQLILSPQHPPPDFYTCQTTLSDTDPVGIACRIVDSKVEYVSVMILSFTKEWFLDTNNMSCCFVPTDRYAMCRFWFPLLKDKTTWEKFGMEWYLSNFLENTMVLKALVDAILQSQRDPYNLLHVQLVQTLKKDISHDVTEAFTASQRLVDQYPELYRNSSSFLDFLFKLCHVPSPPQCQEENVHKTWAAKETELESLKETLRKRESLYDIEKRDYEAQISIWKEKTLQYEAQIRSLQEHLSRYDVEIKNLQDQLINCQKELQHCLDGQNEPDRTLGIGGLFKPCPIEEPPHPALDYPGATDSSFTCQALEFHPQKDLEDQWKQELRSFLEEFKNDMSTNFTLTKEQNENISKLLETLPLLTPSEPLVESPKECLGATGSTCQELEFPSQNERVVEKIDEWKQELRSFLEEFKKDMSTNFTLTKAQNENISKLLETLPPDKPSSLEPLVKPTALADEISEKLFNTFEQLLHRKLSQEHLNDMLQTFQLNDHFKHLKNRITNSIHLGKTRQKVLAHVNDTEYKVKKVIESLFQKLSTLFGSDLPSLHLLERLDLLEEKLLEQNTRCESSKVQEFVRQNFPSIAFSEDWQELFIKRVESSLTINNSFQEQLKRVANHWSFNYVDENDWFITIERKFQHSQGLERQLTETNTKLNSIYHMMVENLDYDTKMVAMKNPTNLDQGFFQWVKNGVMKLKIELDLVREQLVQAIEAPTSYEVTELHELPAICGVDVDSELKMERDQLKQERDQLKQERDQLKEERYQFWEKGNQLKEEGDQLKEERNQLWGENKQLEVERDQLWEQNNQLKIERDQLKFEKNQLIEEKAQFWKENEQLKIEKNQLNEEKGQLLNENNQLKVEKDQFWKENDRLMNENNSLKVHVNKLTQHGKELANEFTQEKYKLDKQCNVSKKQWEAFLKECKKLVDPVNIQTFVTDVQKKYSVHEEIVQNGVQLLNYFHMTLSNPNWSQEIISKFKQLEYYKVQYEKLLADHEETQNKSEKELESIMEDNIKQQQQLKQQLMKCETDLMECREKLMEPKSETIVERGTCISIQNKKFKRRSTAEEEDTEEYWRTRCFELEKQLSKPTHEISLLKMKCLFMAFFHLYFKLMYDFKWKKLPQELEPDLNREIWDKLKRLDNLLKQDRDNELLNTLLIYVDAELRVILLGECAVNIFKDKLKKCKSEKQLLDASVEETVKYFSNVYDEMIT
ncbi:uncharacterized protein TNCT_350341 [Trichonephila clavata]|uniref:Uncharacterized protein n=1 Tax=Trichonephila clavata TaxID=2740835 RepID=A0A8X6KKC4_TRICU|nr:uncharacterized protein TNCT_350341 [Trichonephila clavata]